MRRLTKIDRSRIEESRPNLTLVVADMFIREIWVAGRAPIITIHDYDWGETDPAPERDASGIPFIRINWRRPAWRLGLSLHPPEKETYTMANQSLKTIPLKDLKVSKLNMRHGRKKPDISDILPSIREHGLRQTLLVRKEGKHYGVVAGRRRLFALKQIAKEEGKAMRVPCIVMREGDDAEAIEASLTENIARLPATDMEQYVAFKQLHDEGRNVFEIAEYFGVTELTVKRTLALASLIASIRALYTHGDIDRETVRALTLASEAQQAEWLRLYEAENEHAPHGRRCKAWITGGDTITTDKALFDIDAYDGEVIADLFGDGGVFADADVFWQAQSAAIAAKKEAYLAAGWRDVHVLDRGQYFHTYDRARRSKSKGGRVFVEVRYSGETIFHEGYVTQAEARKMERAASGEAEPVTNRPEISGPLATYLLRHRHARARAALLDAPDIALRLMLAHALVGSALWTVRPQPDTVRKEATAASLAASSTVQRFTAETETVNALFAALGVGSLRTNSDPYHLCEVFTALLAMSDDEVRQVLAYVMADTLEAGSPVVEAVLHVLDVDLTVSWAPDAAFFDLTRDKRAINAMVSEIAGASVAEGALTETGKVQKEIITNRLTGTGCEARSDWRPRWMQVPPSRYVEGAGSAPADAWDRVAALFDAKEESDTDEPAEPESGKQAA